MNTTKTLLLIAACSLIPSVAIARTFVEAQNEYPVIDCDKFIPPNLLAGGVTIQSTLFIPNGIVQDDGTQEGECEVYVLDGDGKPTMFQVAPEDENSFVSEEGCEQYAKQCAGKRGGVKPVIPEPAPEKD